MTFREKLAHVAKDDPDFARAAKRWRIASWLFGIAVVAALGFAGWSLAIGFSNSTQITKIESPCVKYGSDSPQCEEAFSAAVATITHPQACAVERKAGTLRAIRELAGELGVDFTEPCAGARIEQERVRGNERAASRGRAASGGGAQTGSTGTLQPGPREGGSSEDVGTGKQRGGSDGTSGGGGHDRPAPAPSPSPETVPSPSPQPSPGRSGDAPGDPDPPASPSPGTVPSTVEAAGGAVKEAGEGVGGAVEGVGKGVDCALRGAC
jgi:hypothetical protein